MYNSVKSSNIAESKQHFGDHYISDHQEVLCVCIPRMSHIYIYVCLEHLTRLVVLENVIDYSCCESVKSRGTSILSRA